MRIALAVSLALALAPVAQAQDAKDVVDKAIQAHGGAEKLARAKMITRTAKGEITSLGAAVKATCELSASLPGKGRWAFELDAGNQKIPVTVVINGDKGWRSGGGMARELTKGEMEEQLPEADVLWLSTLLPLKENGITLANAAETKVGGEPALGVKVTRKGRPDVTLYFDKKTNLLVKIERRGKEAGLDITKEYILSDFKDAEGGKLPAKIVELVNGKKVAEWTVSGYKFPAKFDETTFGKP